MDAPRKPAEEWSWVHRSTGDPACGNVRLEVCVICEQDQILGVTFLEIGPFGCGRESVRRRRGDGDWGSFMMGSSRFSGAIGALSSVLVVGVLTVCTGLGAGAGNVAEAGARKVLGA